MSPAPEGRNVPLGLAMMLFAFFSFAIMETSAKWLITSSFPVLQVVFVRYLGHFVFVLTFYLPREGKRIVVSNNYKLQLLRAALLLVNTVLNFASLYYLPLTVVVSILFLAPMVVTLLSVPILGERVGTKRFLAILFGFVGVLIITKPWDESFDIHSLYAVGAMLAVSGYFLLSRVVSVTDKNAVTQFYSSGLATIFFLPFAYYLWNSPASLIEIVLLSTLGAVGLVGHSLLTNAHRHAEASVLSPTIYSQIIFVSVLGWLIFDSIPSASTIVGSLIIVCSGIYVWHRERIPKEVKS